MTVCSPGRSESYSIIRRCGLCSTPVVPESSAISWAACCATAPWGCRATTSTPWCRAADGRSPSGWPRRCRPGWSSSAARSSPPTGWSAGDVTVDLWDRAGTSLHEDLARRDFTVNSFALDARTGEVIDPFGGLADLGGACCGPPRRRASPAIRCACCACRACCCASPASPPIRETLLLARRSSPRLAGRGRRAGARRAAAPLRSSRGAPRARPAGGARRLPGPLARCPRRAGPARRSGDRAGSAAGALRELRQLDTGAADAGGAPAARLAAATFAHCRAGRPGSARFPGALPRRGLSHPRSAAKVALLLAGGELRRRAGPAAIPPPRRPALGHRRRLARARTAGGRGRWRAALRPWWSWPGAKARRSSIRRRLVTGEGGAGSCWGSPPGPEVGPGASPRCGRRSGGEGADAGGGGAMGEGLRRRDDPVPAALESLRPSTGRSHFAAAPAGGLAPPISRWLSSLMRSFSLSIFSWASWRSRA